MKKLIYLSSISFMLLLVSCDMNDKNVGRLDSEDPQSGWVQFDDELVGAEVTTVYGAVDAISLPVKLYAPVNKDGLEVSYTITDVVGNSSAIVPERTGIVEIKKNTVGNVVVVGDLVININPDAGLESNVEFDVTLTGTNRSNVEVGLSDNSKPVVVRIKICAYNIGTTYGGTAVSSTGFNGPAYNVTLVPVAGTTNEFTTTSAWGPLFVPTLCACPVVRDYPVKITINEDFTVTVVNNHPTIPSTQYIGGSGTYDPCTDTFNIILQQGIFTNPFTVNVVWSPAS